MSARSRGTALMVTVMVVAGLLLSVLGPARGAHGHAPVRGVQHGPEQGQAQEQGKQQAQEQAQKEGPGRDRAGKGIHVSDGRVVEGNGRDFVMRGVNHPYAWHPGETSSIAHIKAEGANTVRVAVSTGDRWKKNDADDVAGIVKRCKQNRLICVLDVHDTTGYGEDGTAISLDEAVDYWISVQEALAGQEDYVVVNIGNEPRAHFEERRWTVETKRAVREMRRAGFDHALMVNAPSWGQDWFGTMRKNAASVFASDPDRNTIFSVHMYGIYDTAAEVRGYLRYFTKAGLPLVVGEFGHNHSDGDPDEDTIISTAQDLEVGYIGWSWSGNGGGVEYLDMVEEFDPEAMTEWGERIFYGRDGIAATAKEASVYADGSGNEGNGGGSGGKASRDDEEAESAGSGRNLKGTTPAGHRYCLGGGSSDRDGDGLGWEYDEPCVVLVGGR